MADSLLDFFLDEHAWQQEAGRVGENGAERDGAGALVDGDFAELQLAGLVVAGAVLEQEAAGDLVGAGALDLSAAEFALEAEMGAEQPGAGAGQAGFVGVRVDLLEDCPARTVSLSVTRRLSRTPPTWGRTSAVR